MDGNPPTQNQAPLPSSHCNPQQMSPTKSHNQHLDQQQQPQPNLFIPPPPPAMLVSPSQQNQPFKPNEHTAPSSSGAVPKIHNLSDLYSKVRKPLLLSNTNATDSDTVFVPRQSSNGLPVVSPQNSMGKRTFPRNKHKRKNKVLKSQDEDADDSLSSSSHSDEDEEHKEEESSSLSVGSSSNGDSLAAAAGNGTAAAAAAAVGVHSVRSSGRPRPDLIPMGANGAADKRWVG